MAINTLPPALALVTGAFILSLNGAARSARRIGVFFD